MQIFFDTRAKEMSRYKSKTQKVRFLSEHWVDREVFCPNCGKDALEKFENNRPAADFYCKNCNEEYELKSKKDSIGNQVVDGAYKTMINRLKSDSNPNFFFLRYDPKNHSVKNFIVIPKHFFVPDVIKKRKPLPQSARRAGWVGCNILLNSVPNDGRIFYIKNGSIETRKSVLKNWQKTLFLRKTHATNLRGWTLDIMKCIDELNKKEFALEDIYTFENDLSKKHTENMHIKQKIRQQLQFLRDKGYLTFINNKGRYRVK